MRIQAAKNDLNMVKRPHDLDEEEDQNKAKKHHELDSQSAMYRPHAGEGHRLNLPSSLITL
jgi:hypothetical protein